MKKIRQSIINFKIENNMMYIICNKYTLLLNIINGSIEMNCLNELNEKIGINELYCDDNIIIYFREIDNNFIKPIKIIKMLNYAFNSETTDSETFK
jgi:hypothetical protein